MIQVTNLCLTAGSFQLSGVTFGLETGEYGVLMGRTGSGKTTILEALCGLRRASSGVVELGGRDVTHSRPGSRGIGYVPQDAVLFPTLTVREQIAFAPRLRRWDAELIEARVQELAGRLGIEQLLDRRPAGLSGGERQRVALGRALAAHPAVLLLDEPLAALDDDTREEIQELLAGVRQERRVTILHVTHRRAEVKRLADRRFVLRDGSIVFE